jgi:hypothetical protein
MWIPLEVRDAVFQRDPARKQVGHFGAARLSDGRFQYRQEMGRFNAQTCWQCLRSLRRICRNRWRRVVVTLDNATFHHARLHGNWREKVARGFESSFLPAHSPDLNPIERAGKLARRLCWRNR